MGLRFKTFRRILAGIIIAISCTCFCLTLSLLPYFTRTSIAWVVASLQLLSILRTLFSTLRKTLLREAQSVASETISLFILFPFQLILGLVILSSPFIPDLPNEFYAPLVLQIFIIINSAIHVLYTAGLVFVSTLTVSAFDRDIWIRDFDASPSPFPLSILLAFSCPCCCSLPDTERQQIADEEESHGSVVPCLPGCNCMNKPQAPDITEVETGLRPVRSSILSGWRGSSESLSHKLVRVPNEVERRSSIAVAFEVDGVE
ncbi:hypothetical protein AMATHDRAFT_69242 [Amanita thiersii Skay4041]|uniref:Transmembrane protein n=1 Tax=Amanita thiersii Skay4041 TaxID=703135 RepID=A0A2A9N7Y9_9AGAR|nr:hypothetical protein AMATHDRAFT_69242 [Amanita thiersii Skay4041]